MKKSLLSEQVSRGMLPYISKFARNNLISSLMFAKHILLCMRSARDFPAALKIDKASDWTAVNRTYWQF